MSLVAGLRRRTVSRNFSRHWFHASASLERHNFSTSFKRKQGADASTARPQITATLLPYAIALIEASHLSRPLVGSSVTALLEKLYSRPGCPAADVRQLPTDLAQQINYTYGTMDAMATAFAAYALNLLSPSGGTTPTSVSLSPTEHFRFCRAFYRVELFHTLDRRGAFGWGASAHDTHHGFFLRHPPWENEQLCCVYEYLRIRLDQGLLPHAKMTRTSFTTMN